MDKAKEVKHASPVFVVGHPRSGTTLVATIIGRHQNISMPPETQFFPEIYDKQNGSGPELARLALDNSRVSDLELSEERFIKEFNATSMTFKDLFELIIRSYCEKVGKSRPGEKSPNHLKWADTLLSWFPDGKIIVVIRDGRDVVSSLMNVPWSHKNIIKHSFDWAESQEHARSVSENFPANIQIVQYENLLDEPDVIVSKLCDFLAEKYDSAMLNPGESEAVPNWETEWKKKARLGIDSSNIGKWKNRRSIDKAIMNTLMATQLEENHYRVELPSILLRIGIWIVAWPYHSRIRPIFSRLKSFIVRRPA